LSFAMQAAAAGALYVRFAALTVRWE
jgi:hypothetical protein